MGSHRQMCYCCAKYLRVFLLYVVSGEVLDNVTVVCKSQAKYLRVLLLCSLGPSTRECFCCA